MGLCNGDASSDTQKTDTEFSHLRIRAPSGLANDIQPGTTRRTHRQEPFFIGVAGKALYARASCFDDNKWMASI